MLYFLTDYDRNPEHFDLEAQRVWDSDEEEVVGFDIDPFRRESLLKGLDDIGLTLEHEDKIASFEAQRGPHGGGLMVGGN